MRNIKIGRKLMRSVYTKILLVCILSGIIFPVRIYPQDYLFKVIAVSGNVTCQMQTGTTWEKVRTGDRVSSGELLKLGAGDYLGLISKKGRSLELKQNGIFKAEELYKNIKKGSSSLQKFTDFVMNESVANKRKTENMKTLGAVVRSKNELIDVFFPENTDLLSSSFKASWYSSSTAASYVFKLVDQQNRTLVVKETNDTSLVLNLKQYRILNNHTYKWFVSAKGNDELKSDFCSFRLLGKNNIKSIKDSINIVKKNLDLNSAVGQFILIKFFESKNLNSDAMEGYENLIRSNPDIEDYSNNYISFLLKQNISRKAELLLSSDRR
jgi:hypothetical protein